LDAADLSTMTLNSNNNISIWADKSSTGNNATNVNADGVSNTPLTNSNPNLSAISAGGQRVVTFNGTNWLNINLTVITNSTYSIIALTQLSPTRTANNDYYMGTAFTGSGNDQVLHIGYRNAGSYTWAQYADDMNVAYPATPIIASTFMLRDVETCISTEDSCRPTT